MPDVAEKDLIGYGQIQECVSFAKLCLMLYRLDDDIQLLKEAYAVCVKWENWLEKTE